jgi:tetratricopeptide (TPR) repeat protein
MSATSLAQTKPKVFIAPTQDGFANFITSALIENKVPIEITVDESNAAYVIVSSGIVKGQNRWYDTVFGAEKDRNQGSMKIIRVSDRVVVWGSSTGDNSFWFHGLKNMGQAKVANRLARKLKRDLPNIMSPDENKTAESDNKNNVSEILEKETGVLSSKPIQETKKPVVNAKNYNEGGYYAFNRKEYSNAEASYRTAIEAEPNNAVYHSNLAAALNAQGKFEEAEKAIELAVSLAPNNPIYKKNLETVRSNKNAGTFYILKPTF